MQAQAWRVYATRAARLCREVRAFQGLRIHVEDLAPFSFSRVSLNFPAMLWAAARGFFLTEFYHQSTLTLEFVALELNL